MFAAGKARHLFNYGFLQGDPRMAFWREPCSLTFRHSQDKRKVAQFESVQDSGDK